MITRKILHYYLKTYEHSRNYGLYYIRYTTVIEGYNDAKLISGMKYLKSTSEYVLTLYGANISWKFSKHTFIARSTMESDFIVLDKRGEEVEWLCNFLEDLSKWAKLVPMICNHCDTQFFFGMTQINMYKGKSWHIHSINNIIKWILSIEIIFIDYLKSKDNIKDALTKRLSIELVELLSNGMGLKYMNKKRFTK